MGSYEDVNLDVIEEPLSVIEQNLSFSVSVQSGFEEQACLEAACRVFESNVELASAPDGFLGSSEVDDTFRVSSVEVTEEGRKVLCVNKDDLVGEGENVGDLMLEKVPGNECGISGDCLDGILCLGDVCSLENGGLCLEKEGSRGEGDYEKPLESSPLTDLQRNCVQMDDKCVSSSSAERVTEVKTDQSGVLDGAETDIHSLISSSQGCEMPSDLILKTGLPNNHTQQNEQEDTKSVGGLSSEVMYGKRASSAETETIFCNPILPSGDLVSNGDWHSDQKDEKNVSDLSAETVTEILETNNHVDTCTQASTSWGCQSDLENLHKAESPSICAKQNEQSGVLDGVETDIHNLISSSQGCEMPSDLVLKTGLPDNHTQQNEQEDTKSVGGLSLEVMDGKRDSSAETETAFCKPVLPSGDLVSNGDWHSDQKVEKTVSDLSEETFTEILETKNDVDTCTQASTSWGCQSDSENLHKAESLSICARQNEQKDGEGVDGPCVERVSNVVQDKGDIITVVSVEFDTHILPLEENSCKSEEGDTKIVHNCNFEKSVSPQSCQPFVIVNHSTSKDTPDQDAIGSINSSSVVESSGHTDNEGKDNVGVGCVSETKCSEVASSSSRRNNQRSKSRQKTHRKRAAKKCKNAANVPHPHESIGIVLKVGRRKRSCLSKPARSSMWGLLGHITQFLEQGNMLDGVNQFHNQGLGKARRGQGSRKQKKIRGSGNSGGSRGNRCASTGLIRLKVKVGKVAGESCLSNMVPEVVNTLASADATTSDDQTEMHSGTGLELSKLANGVEDKSREDETGLHPQCFSKLPEKAKTLPDGFIMDGQLATSGSENTNILDKTAGGADNYLEVPSHVVVEALGGEIDSKFTDPGTSPDSEVINLIPDVQVAARHQADLHDAVLTASKDVAARRCRTSSKRGKKDRLPRSRNSVLEDGSQGPVSMNEAKPSKKQGCRQDISNGSKASKSASKRGNVQRQREKQRKSVNNCKVKDKDACNQIVCKVETQPESVGSQKVDGIGTANTGDDTAVTNKSDLEMVRGGLEEQLLPPRKAWVLCDDCHKWRRIPAVLADFIEKTNCTWTCKDNLDKAFAACSISQEKSNAEINVELDISDASGEEDACGARLNFKGLDCRRSTGYQDSTFKCISTNEFLHRKRRSQTIDEIMVCSCEPNSKGQLGCGEGCLNRMLSIECVQGACPCGDLCSNQQFQKQKYANLEWFRCGKKGYGLKLLEDISEGKFLIEYVGEVLNMQAYEARQKEYALKGHRHFYFMTLNGSEVIDACAKGNLGRFINHSCDPNCRTEKWIVNGEICIGLFALRNIKKGEELTFDYNYVRVFGAAAKKCYCGASQCRGYIGGDLLNTEVIVQGDSDEEFPEPVMVPEGGKGRNGLDYMMPRAIRSDSAEIKAAKGMLKDRNGLDEATAAVEQLKSTIEKEEPMNQSANSQLLSSLELEDSKGNSPSFVQSVELSHQTEDVTRKHMPAVLQETSIEEETLNKTSFNGDRLEIISPTMLSKSLGHGVDANRKSKFETVEDKRVSVKSHSLMKGSRSSSSVKKEKVRSSPLNTNQVQVTANKSQVLSIKSKKLLEGSSNGRSEAVEEKLNELLDTDGGISKRKDAPKGYLKLLLLTAASGDSGNGEAIQSNRDLSMILDALLKTKSRAVLIDIINKNGLRMLHNIMKQYRRDFKKIPILRKLLKVLEYLAMREILTPEHINGGPPCPGMESFRASILSFTEHDDKQVHQIARNFRDKWIPRPVRKLSYLDRDDGRMESRRGSNCNRSAAQPGYWHDQHVRPTEAIDCVKQAMVATTSGDTGLQEGCFSPCVGSCPAKETKPRKRKSRWDQPAETNPDSRSSERKEQKIESTLLQQCESRPSQGGVEVAVDHIDSGSRKNRNCPGCVQNQCQHDEATRADNERQNIPEDVPPGFSSPRALGTLNASSTVIDLHQQNVCHAKCPDDAIIGQPQEKFISRLPVSYGIPLSIVQRYGTPQEESAECWVIAPGMPFYPFPPLPQFPRDHKDHAPLHSLNPLTINQPAEEGRRDSNCPAPYADETTPCANSQQTFKRARDSSYDLGRRYFRQQKWNNTKLGPPWIRKRNGWEHMGDNSRGETCSIGIENVGNEPKNSYLSEDVGCRVEKAGNFFYQHSQHQDHH